MEEGRGSGNLDSCSVIALLVKLVTHPRQRGRIDVLKLGVNRPWVKLTSNHPWELNWLSDCHLGNSIHWAVLANPAISQKLKGKNTGVRPMARTTVDAVRGPGSNCQELVLMSSVAVACCAAVTSFVSLRWPRVGGKTIREVSDPMTTMFLLPLAYNLHGHHHESVREVWNQRM